ncbi:hypothetical protein ACO0RG_001069 [Hanseniaspora osmophila]|uniref:phosphoinositide 5-phosphatase n=1 Tax=Hanseniaspora osmophila TaxID=56408 RepID=A0A1E5RNS9_9ASCO|nr:Polyphosphatidylinositol phosphatase INP53 [Hanseniaspora osmophila]
MEIYVQQHPDHRKIALCSSTHALIFQALNADGSNGRSRSDGPSCSMELKPKDAVTSNRIQEQNGTPSSSATGQQNDSSKFFQRLTFKDIHGFIGLIEVEKLIFIVCITGTTKVASPVPGETVNKIFSVEFFCLNDSRWDFIEIDSSGYPILDEHDQLNEKNGNYGDADWNSQTMGNINENYSYNPSRNGNSRYDSSRSRSSPPEQNMHPLMGKHPANDLKKLLSNGSFYYSSDFDLTSSLQKRGGLSNKHSLSLDQFQEEYMWNSFLMQEMVSYRDRLNDEDKQILDEQGFLTTVIRGFAETFVSYINELKCSLTVISKQSWKRAGTRYNARGMDDEGNVANFVETEFVMYSKEYCYAFVEVRGSVPVFWEQDTSLLNPRVSVTRSVEATQATFDTHFERLYSKYGPINIVNLLSKKSSEIELTRRYRAQYEHSKVKNEITMTEFDFHKETASEGFAASIKIKPLIENFLLNSGYYSYDVVAKKTMCEQYGVFRVNCLDCLDRTNLIQQFISNLAFKLFLKDFNLMKGMRASMFNDDTEVFVKHNSLWADNGDQISQIYTGTNALKSSFSRKGKMSFAGALSDATKSVSRIYINNFMDKDKQNNIDKLLGKLPDQIAVQLYDPMMDYVSAKMKLTLEQYSSSELINIFIGTYNVNGITRKADLTKWLFPIGDKFKPDIVVLGLQEVIELTAGSILNADYTKSSLWEKMVNDCLNQFGENDKYLMLRTEQMTSLLVLFFVRADKIDNVKQVEGGSKKTGFGGITGNKGAVAIRFNYGETSFCFLNSHLAAGATALEERKLDYENIIKGIKFNRGRTVSIHDNIFWLGDLNYRIELDNLEVRKMLSDPTSNNIQRLLENDQLNKETRIGRVFDGFKEPSIKFLPTYKYDLGTNMYDTSEKARTPSWTDRILYKGNDIRPLSYSDVPLTFSDHKPVYAAYRAKVEFVDPAKKELFIVNFQNEWKKSHHLKEVSVGEQISRPPSLDPAREPHRPQLPPKPRKTVQLHNDVSLLDLDLPAESSNDSSSTLSLGDSVASSRTSNVKSAPPLIPNKPSNLSLNTTHSAFTSERDIPVKPHSSVPPPLPAPRRKISNSSSTTMPPGFDQGLTLKSKDGTPKAESPLSPGTPALEKKIAPVKPVKKPDLSVNSWKPLTPK